MTDLLIGIILIVGVFGGFMFSWVMLFWSVEWSANALKRWWKKK